MSINEPGPGLTEAISPSKVGSNLQVPQLEQTPSSVVSGSTSGAENMKDELVVKSGTRAYLQAAAVGAQSLMARAERAVETAKAKIAKRKAKAKLETQSINNPDPPQSLEPATPAVNSGTEKPAETNISAGSNNGQVVGELVGNQSPPIIPGGEARAMNDWDLQTMQAILTIDGQGAEATRAQLERVRRQLKSNRPDSVSPTEEALANSDKQPKNEELNWPPFAPEPPPSDDLPPPPRFIEPISAITGEPRQEPPILEKQAGDPIAALVVKVRRAQQAIRSAKDSDEKTLAIDNLRGVVQQLIDEASLKMAQEKGRILTDQERVDIERTTRAMINESEADRRVAAPAGSNITVMPEEALLPGETAHTVSRELFFSGRAPATVDGQYLPGGESPDPVLINEKKPQKKKKTSEEKEAEKKARQEEKQQKITRENIHQYVKWFESEGYLDDPEKLTVVLKALQSTDAIEINGKKMDRTFTENDQNWIQTIDYLLKSPLNPYRIESPYKEARATPEMINGLTKEELVVAEQLVYSRTISPEEFGYKIALSFHPEWRGQKDEAQKVANFVHAAEMQVVRGEVNLNNLPEELRKIITRATDQVNLGVRSADSNVVIFKNPADGKEIVMPQLTKDQQEELEKTALTLRELARTRRPTGLRTKLFRTTAFRNNHNEWQARISLEQKKIATAKAEAEATRRAVEAKKAAGAASETAENTRINLTNVASRFIESGILIEIDDGDPGHREKVLSVTRTELVENLNFAFDHHLDAKHLDSILKNLGATRKQLDRLSRGLALFNSTTPLERENLRLLITLQNLGFGADRDKSNYSSRTHQHADGDTIRHMGSQPDREKDSREDKLNQAAVKAMEKLLKELRTGAGKGASDFGKLPEEIRKPVEDAFRAGPSFQKWTGSQIAGYINRNYWMIQSPAGALVIDALVESDKTRKKTKETSVRIARGRNLF